MIEIQPEEIQKLSSELQKDLANSLVSAFKNGAMDLKTLKDNAEFYKLTDFINWKELEES